MKNITKDIHEFKRVSKEEKEFDNTLKIDKNVAKDVNGPFGGAITSVYKI